ncbi:MAG: hypothetical protein H3C51_11435 [Rubellimicrobium sp.]|nr:hypothetical protein [Rubellimicrobium sp.]
MRILAAAAPVATLFALSAPAANAQAGVDPQLYAMLDAMISQVYYACQMGSQQSCASVQPMQAQAQYLIQAGQYCAQTGDPNACGYYQSGVMQAQAAYTQMNRMNAPMAPVPTYDPNNPLGPTHADRMRAIQNFGAVNTQNFNDRMNQMDIQQQQFLDYINN